MDTSIFNLKGRGGVLLLTVVVVSLIGTMIFFHMLALLGIGVLGTIAYGFDRTVGVRINNKRRPAPIQGESPKKEQGLWIYEQDMWTRIKFLFWSFVVLFTAGLVLGKFSLANVIEMPTFALAFFIGMLFGPLGFRAWQNRREIAAKADFLEKGLIDGSINPLSATKAAAASISAEIVGVVSELTKSTESPVPAATPSPPQAPPPAIPVEKPVDRLDEANATLERFLKGNK